MYKVIQNKKYYLAIETFRKECKIINITYRSGIRTFDYCGEKTYFIVIYNFRIAFCFKKEFAEY